MSQPQFEEGVYQIFSTKRSSVDHIDRPFVVLQTGGIDPLLELWIITKINDRDGYYIQNRSTKRYTYVQGGDVRKPLRLTDYEGEASAWDIQHTGGEDYNIVLAEHDRVWTAVPSDWSFETQGRNGEPNQIINFFKVDIPHD